MTADECSPPSRRLLPAVVFAVLAVVLVAALALRPGVSRRSVEELRAEMVACSGGDMSEGRLIADDAQACLYRVLSTAVAAGQMMDAQTALAAQIEQTPGLYAACHTVGHRAGREAFEKRGDIAALIRENATTTCQYAFGHGILDGFAFAGPSDDEFRAAADACVGMRLAGAEGNKVYKLCSDGLGHAAWTSTGRLPHAVARCRMLDDELARAVCGEGIVMQIYEPAGSLPTEDLTQAPTGMLRLCLSWPDRTETLDGCYSGAGYVYTRAAWVLHYQRNSNDGALLDAGQRTRMRDLMLDAVALCGTHPEERGQRICRESVAQQVPPSVYEDRALTDEVCVALLEAEQRCREFRFVVS